VRIERLDAITARGLGVGPGGSLLVRPDGHPVALQNDPQSAAVAQTAQIEADREPAPVARPIEMEEHPC
jgi:hypothetical protein